MPGSCFLPSQSRMQGIQNDTSFLFLAPLILPPSRLRNSSLPPRRKRRHVDNFTVLLLLHKVQKKRVNCTLGGDIKSAVGPRRDMSTHRRPEECTKHAQFARDEQRGAECSACTTDRKRGKLSSKGILPGITLRQNFHFLQYFPPFLNPSPYFSYFNKDIISNTLEYISRFLQSMQLRYT